MAVSKRWAMVHMEPHIRIFLNVVEICLSRMAMSAQMSVIFAKPLELRMALFIGILKVKRLYLVL